MAEYGVNGTTLNLEHLAFRAQNASAWSADHLLLAGEIGVELDTKKYKLGDGTTQWSELAYYSNPVTDNLVSQLTSRVTTAEGTLTVLGGRMDTAENNITSQGTRLTTAESDIDAAEGRLDTAEADIDALEAKDTEHESRMSTIEGVNMTQGEKIDALERITTISANSFRG